MRSTGELISPIRGRALLEVVTFAADLDEWSGRETWIRLDRVPGTDISSWRSRRVLLSNNKK